MVHELDLTDLPEAIGRLTALRVLDAGHNRLASLPESLRRLGELDILYFHENELGALPPTLFELGRLTYLNRDRPLAAGHKARLPRGGPSVRCRLGRTDRSVYAILADQYAQPYRTGRCGTCSAL